jgi:polyisoprenoid-binding protein YceI
MTTTTRTALPVGTWTLDKAHSSISFVARHMMVTKVRGTFPAYDATIEVAENPADSKVNIEIEVGSITTGAPDRDGHLVSPDFFDVANHPTMKFASTRIHEADGQWRLTGDLTIKDVTRPVTLDVSFEGIETNPWGKTIAAFTASTEVDRDTWGLTWNVPLESGGLLVGKKVKLEIEAQLVQS